MPAANQSPGVAIACGGTGGHLFPGLAVAEVLQQQGWTVTLFISAKEVDRFGVSGLRGMRVVALPAVALNHLGIKRFILSFFKSYRQARSLFCQRRPDAILAMGGFASAAPVLAMPAFSVPAFLHEANAVPGRANRWLAPWVDQAFVYFPAAAARLRGSSVTVVGMPVRSQFQRLDSGACRMVLGLAPQRPVVLVMGGSQGAAGINDLMVGALPGLLAQAPDLQFLHLTGTAAPAPVAGAYRSRTAKAVVRPFLTEMEYALGAATVAVSRAGASSLAELAAMRLPAILIPYPYAADNHQFHNASAFVASGAARMITQEQATPEILVRMILELVQNPGAREALSAALAPWHNPQAATQIAERIIGAAADGPGVPDLSANPQTMPFAPERLGAEEP